MLSYTFLRSTHSGVLIRTGLGLKSSALPHYGGSSIRIDENRVRDLSELEESGCHCQFLIPSTPNDASSTPTTCSNTKHAQHIACVAEHAALGESSSVEHSSRMMCRRLTVIAAVCVPHLAGQSSNYNAIQADTAVKSLSSGGARAGPRGETEQP